MTKLGAIVRYELLMAWRRRSLPLLWLMLVVGVTGFALLIDNANTQIMPSIEAQVAAGHITWEQFNSNLLFSLMVAAMIVYSVGVTLIVGEVIPLDKQFRLRELFGTLPVNTATYLGGKLLGVWAGLVIGWVGVGLITAVAHRLIFGAYDLRIFLLLWVLLPLPATLTAAALSVLISALVNSRRMAVLVGLMALPFIFYLNATGVVNFVNLAMLIDPIYRYGSPVIPSREEMVTDAARGLLIHVGVIGVTWGIVWSVLNWREGRG